MKKHRFLGSSSSTLSKSLVLSLLMTLLAAADTQAATQLVMGRDSALAEVEYKGVVELTITPGFPDARVNVSVDGQQIAEGLRSPYKVTVDFGPMVVEHKIGVTAFTPDWKRTQWSQTINRGHRPLSVKLRMVDAEARLFEAEATSPDEDPISAVQLWDNGAVLQTVSAAPYRFTVSEQLVAGGFIQVTAKTKSGEEAADFWSATGDVHVESLEVRTVPIYVSVVDRNGKTRDDIDVSLFRVMDNGTEGKILEFGRAFDQPISIALLVDASSSMTYLMDRAAKAADGFVQKALKPGDRCTVYAVKDVPRRMQELTSDKVAIEKALTSIKPLGRTSLYDSILVAIRELKEEKSRRAIVILTDGNDTSSVAGFDEVDRVATEAGIPLYFVTYDSGMEDFQQDLDRLHYLAGQTGGFVAGPAQENLQARYNEIEKALRAQYAIRYQIADYKKRNEWRKVKVVLASPKLTARTIRGYFAP